MRVKIFRHTYSELVTLIQGSEEWIGNPFYDPFCATASTRFFVSNNYTRDEVAEFASSLVTRLGRYQIEIDDMDYPGFSPRGVKSEKEYFTVKLFQFGNAQGKDYLSVLSVILNIVLFAVPISFQIVVGKPLDAHNFISKWLQKMLSKKYKKYGYDKDEEERLQNEYNEVMGTLDELKERISERIPIGV